MISAYQKLHIAGVQGKMKACKWEGSFSIVLYKMFPLQGYGKGTALCLLLLLRHTFMTAPVVPFLSSPDFKCHPVSPKSPLQQFPLQRAHGKEQSSCESEKTLWGSDAQNATAELEAALRRERKEARRKQRPVWTCASQGELFLSTSWRAGSGRKDEGHRVVKLAWKFPTCTIFLIALFSTTFY